MSDLYSQVRGHMQAYMVRTKKSINQLSVEINLNASKLGNFLKGELKTGHKTSKFNAESLVRIINYLNLKLVED